MIKYIVFKNDKFNNYNIVNIYKFKKKFTL